MPEIEPTHTRTIADVGFTRLDEITIASPDGSTAIRYALRLANAVGVVPLDGPNVVLFEQYRAPIGERLLEIPAGVLDIEGEDPVDAAHRELEEEIGFSASELVHLTDILTSPGVVEETIHLYLGIGLEPVPRRPVGPEEQHARVVSMPMDDALQEVRAGRIRDAKTIIGLLLAAER